MVNVPRGHGVFFGTTLFLLAVLFASVANADTVNSRITSDADDGGANYETLVWGTTWNQIALDKDNKAGSFRFTGFTLPDGVVIADARLQLESAATRALETFNLNVYGFRETASQQISGFSDWNSRPRTQSVTWQVFNPAALQMMNSSNIAGVIQEIYDLGERDTFHITLNSSTTIDWKVADSRSTSNDPKLYITYALPEVDTTPPVRSSGQPTGTLSSGTISTTISLTTNEAATCRYSTAAGVAYDSMANTFSTTGGTSHSSAVSGLIDGNSYSYYVRCTDTANNKNTGDYDISFSVALPAGDTTPPVRSNGFPTGTLAAGTTQTTLAATTNESAVCKYSTIAGTGYILMSDTFSTTGGTSHSTNVTGLTGGSTYNYYVRCVDVQGNQNTDDYLISFGVAETPPPLGILTLQPSKDTYLQEGAPTANYGSLTSLLAASKTSGAMNRRSILEFDISGIPSGVSISGATLSLYSYSDSYDGGGGLEAYKLARTDWIEGQAAWNIYKTSSSWTAVGGDYVTSNPSGANLTAGTGWKNFNILAIAQDAYDNSNPVEVLIRVKRESYDGYDRRNYFYSKEYSVDASLRPKLVITYGVDTAPPVRSNGSPSGALVSGTTQATLSLVTNENATCRYSTAAGVAYDSMANTFSTTGGTLHSSGISGLADGGSYAYYVRCRDASNNPNTDDFPISFSVSPVADAVPPALSNGQPVGTLVSGTTSTTISVTTNEAATCRYSTAAGVAYDSMANTFSSTGSTLHSQTVAGLIDGNTYDYYVRCSDGAGNANSDDYAITFSVLATTGNTYYVATSGSDNPSGGTETTPWRTIQYGLNRIGSGDTLVIRGGTYTENLATVSSGTSLNSINMRAYGSGGNYENVIISGSLTINQDYYDISHLKITSSSSSGILITNTAEHIAIHDSEVYGNSGDGIYISSDGATPSNGPNFITIGPNNLIYNNGLDGIFAYPNAIASTYFHNIVITGNNIYGNLEGIDMRKCMGCEISNNLIHENNSKGIGCDLSNNVDDLSAKIFNNTIWDNHSYQLQMRANCRGVEIYDNNVYETVPHFGYGIIISHNAYNNKVYRNVVRNAGKTGAIAGVDNVDGSIFANNVVDGTQGGYGLYMGNPAAGNNITVVNNIVVNTPAAYYEAGLTNGRVDYNLYFNNGGNPDNGPNTLVIDPSFNSTDPKPDPYYRLSSASQAIDSGTIVPGITDGYKGTAPDRGVYEYDSGAP